MSADGAGGAALPERTFAMVIGALGGEGGGVLSGWIVAAAESLGYPVQSTSIPGVAQRTGATTYYIEIYPATHDALDGRSPVMALYATPGNMDVVVASELMEAGRALELGWVTPARTTLVASAHRVFSILEKSAMGDGRFETSDLRAAAERLAKRAILFDMERLAEAHGAAVNAVMLGVIAGSGETPVPAEAYERAIETSGVAVAANLRGFKAGLGFVRGEVAMPEDPASPERGAKADSAAPLLARIAEEFPAETRQVMRDGFRRVVDYQDAAYGRRFFDNAARILAADEANGGAERGYALTVEAARYLALWMTYEDIIRVADLKSRPERMARVRREVGAGDDEPLTVTEFLKPGYEEIASVLPPRLGRALTLWADRKPSRRKFHVAMRVKTNTAFGYARLRALAKLRFWRPRTWRFAEEWAEIEAWVGVLEAASPRGYDLALEIAELPGLRKGYSDTHRRGVANYRRVFSELARPAAEDPGRSADAAAALAAARSAALADPEGSALDAALAGARAAPEPGVAAAAE